VLDSTVPPPTSMLDLDGWISRKSVLSAKAY